MVVPLDKVTSPTADEKAWMEIRVDTTDTSVGRCKYDGVILRWRYISRFQPLWPMFVKEIELRR